MFKQSAISIYYTIIAMLNVGDMGPNSSLATVFISFSMVIGALINAHLFGLMVAYIQTFSIKQKRVQEKLSIVVDVMTDLKIDKKLKDLIKSYVIATESRLHQQYQVNVLLERLPPSIRFHIKASIFEQMLKSNCVLQPFLCSVADPNKQIVSDLVTKFETRLIQPEELIIRMGDQGSSMYFISKGQCMVQEKRFKQMGMRKLRILRESQYFGEIALMFHCNRTMSVMSITHGNLAELSREMFKKIVMKLPLVRALLPSFIKKNYDDKVLVNLLQIAPKLPFFKKIFQVDILSAIFKFKTLYLPPRTVLFKQNQKIEGIYIVHCGGISIQYKIGIYDVPIAYISRMMVLNLDTFIFPNLVYKTKGIAQDFTVVSVLSKDEFYQLSSQFPLFKEEINKEMNQCVSTIRPFILDVADLNPQPRVRSGTLKRKLGRKPLFLFKNAVLFQLNKIKQWRKKTNFFAKFLRQFQKESGKDQIKEHLNAYQSYDFQYRKPNIQDFLGSYSALVKKVTHLGNQLSEHSTNICQIDKELRKYTKRMIRKQLQSDFLNQQAFIALEVQHNSQYDDLVSQTESQDLEEQMSYWQNQFAKVLDSPKKTSLTRVINQQIRTFPQVQRNFHKKLRNLRSLVNLPMKRALNQDISKQKFFGMISSVMNQTQDEIVEEQFKFCDYSISSMNSFQSLTSNSMSSLSKTSSFNSPLKSRNSKKLLRKSLKKIKLQQQRKIDNFSDGDSDDGDTEDNRKQFRKFSKNFPSFKHSQYTLIEQIEKQSQNESSRLNSERIKPTIDNFFAPKSKENEVLQMLKKNNHRKLMEAKDSISSNHQTERDSQLESNFDQFIDDDDDDKDQSYDTVQ